MAAGLRIDPAFADQDFHTLARPLESIPTMTIISEILEHNRTFIERKEALDKHHQSGDDWTATRDYAAEEIGILNGSDALEKVKDFLDKAHAIPDADFKSKRGGLIKEADKMFDADPVQQLRNWTENEIAHLLSNPQLPNAIDERSR